MLREKQREYAKVSKQTIYAGMAATIVAILLGLVSNFTSHDYEFTTIMVALIAVVLFLVGNYAAIVAIRGGLRGK